MIFNPWLKWKKYFEFKNFLENFFVLHSLIIYETSVEIHVLQHNNVGKYKIT